jgi:hypothetical protein
MLKANVAMRRANIIDTSPLIRLLYLDIDQIIDCARTTLRMETLENREMYER